MTTDERSALEDAGRTWLLARDVIAKFLKELRPDLTDRERQHNAAALIARLARHEPPLLICTQDEMKE